MVVAVGRLRQGWAALMPPQARRPMEATLTFTVKAQVGKKSNRSSYSSSISLAFFDVNLMF